MPLIRAGLSFNATATLRRLPRPDSAPEHGRRRAAGMVGAGPVRPIPLAPGVAPVRVMPVSFALRRDHVNGGVNGGADGHSRPVRQRRRPARAPVEAGAGAARKHAGIAYLPRTALHQPDGLVRRYTAGCAGTTPLADARPLMTRNAS